MNKKFCISAFLILLAMSLVVCAYVSHDFSTTVTRAQTAGYDTNWTNGVEAFTIGTMYDYTLNTIYVGVTTANTTYSGNCTMGGNANLEYWVNGGGRTNTTISATGSTSLGGVKADYVNWYYNYSNTNQSQIGCEWYSSLNYDSPLGGDSLDGLPQMGRDIGGFMTGIAPAIGVFILIIVLFVAIAGIVTGIGGMMRKLFDKQ